MNMYHYCFNQMDAAIDKTAMLDTLKRQVIDTLDHGPDPVGLHSALDFLLFLANYNTGGLVPLADTYDEVVQRLILTLHHYHAQVAGPEFAWPACCATCGETHPDDELPDDPDRDDDGDDDEEKIFAIMRELYGSQPALSHTGTRRPYPDYEHWSQWTAEDWVRFEAYRKKVVAAATCEFSTMGLAINSLAAIKANMNNLPLDRQVEVALWASDVADHLTTGIETGLFELCRFSLYTKEGRAVQRQLLSASLESGNHDPD